MGSFIQDFSLIWNIVIFLVAGALVWGAGVKLSKYADEIIEQTGISEFFVGTIGLAIITSLPEIATTISATLANNVGMAVNNLFGSIALQITILAVGDALIKNISLSGSLEDPVSRLQAICLSFLLSIAAIAIIFEDIAIFHTGLFSVSLFLLYIGLSYIVNYFKEIKWWLTEPEERQSIGKVKAIVSEKMAKEKGSNEIKPEEKNDKEIPKILLSKPGILFLFAALVILVAGFFVAISADAITKKAGIGSSFMGFFFVGLTTSLPELSTTITAVQLKRYRMAFSNIFGTNLLNVGLIFIADIFYKEGPVLNEVGNFAATGAILGILLTCIYQIGLTIRLRKNYFRMGFDSLLVIIFYAIGILILYNMQ